MGVGGVAVAILDAAAAGMPFQDDARPRASDLHDHSDDRAHHGDQSSCCRAPAERLVRIGLAVLHFLDNRRSVR